MLGCESEAISTMDLKHLRDNVLSVQDRIAATAWKAGRKKDEVTLIGVSKTQPAEAIRAAYEAGLRHFGENRVRSGKGSAPHSATCKQPGTWSGICRVTRRRGRRECFTVWIRS